MYQRCDCAIVAKFLLTATSFPKFHPLFPYPTLRLLGGASIAGFVHPWRRGAAVANGRSRSPPFHHGECASQTRLGFRKAETVRPREVTTQPFVGLFGVLNKNQLLVVAGLWSLTTAISTRTGSRAKVQRACNVQAFGGSCRKYGSAGAVESEFLGSEFWAAQK